MYYTVKVQTQHKYKQKPEHYWSRSLGWSSCCCPCACGCVVDSCWQLTLSQAIYILCSLPYESCCWAACPARLWVAVCVKIISSSWYI